MTNLSYDNIEDRKEIFNMLSNYLNEQQIKEFLTWCCNECNGSLGLRPGKKSTYHPQEVYWQIMSLAYMHGLDLNKTTKELTRLARLK